MDLGLKQEQKLQLGLKMTLQLQQAIKLLQLSRFELENAISQELMENPVLEERQSAPSTEPEAGIRTDKPLAESPSDEGFGNEQALPAADSTAGASEEFDWNKYFDRYAVSRPEGSLARANLEDMPQQDKRLHTSTDLKGHLHWQLRLSDFDGDERNIGVFIIESLNEDGLFPEEGNGEDVISMIASATGSTPEMVESVLRRVQLFDPVGVASRSMRECLILQAQTFATNNRVIRDILEKHYDLMSAMKFSALSKVLGIPEEEVREAVRIISRFETRPGRNYSPSEPQYVVPDVYVEKVGDEYRIVMNEEGIPRVRINKYYKEYLRSHKKDEATRFIRDKLNSAVWFMNSLQQRRRTIFKVTEAIIRLQKDFLDHGVEHLKPLYLKDVAQEIGMHESTVCRVTANKYVHTPQGLFEMKYFFNNGVGTADGTDMASTAVKSRIAKLLQDEGNGRKLSDREVVAMLARDGIKIARRTVAKYRGQLGIMSSSKRRKRL